MTSSLQIVSADRVFFEGDPSACKTITSNQHRLSSRGTLQPLLGDCDHAVGNGSLSDICESFLPTWCRR